MFHEHPWLNAVVSRIGEAVAMQPVKLEMRAGKEWAQVFEHPVLALMDEPNEDMSGDMLLSMCQQYLELRGEMFIAKYRNKLGAVVELWPIPPHWIAETPSRGNPQFVIRLLGSGMTGGTVTIPRTEIIWHRTPNLKDPYGRGQAKAEAIGDEVQADDLAAKHTKAFYQNNARPDFAVVYDGNVEQEQLTEARNSFEAIYRGVRNAFRVAFLNNSAKIQTFGWSMSDIEHAEGRRLARETIAGLWSVHQMILGISDNVNRANAEVAKAMFNEIVVIPRLRSLSRVLTNQLVKEFDDRLALTFEEPYTGDKEFEHKQIVDAVDRSIITVREARATIPGIEDREDTDVFLLALGKSPVASLAEPPAPKAPPPQKEFRKAITEAEWVRRDGIFRKALDPREKRMLPWLKKRFAKQANEMRANLEKHSPEKSFVQKMSAAQWVDLILFDLHRWQEEAAKEGGAFISEAIEFAGTQAVEEIGLGIAFDVLNPQVVEFLKERQSLIKRIDDTTFDAVRASLIEGYNGGESLGDLMERISTVMDERIGYGAERIARTEMVGAMNGGALEGYRQSGVTKKAWLAAIDERSRKEGKPPNEFYPHVDAHERYNEKAIGIDENFKMHGMHPASGKCPGSMNSAAHDINCRCTILPVVED